MIRVTLELIPATNPKAVRHLGTITIANDGVKSRATDSREGDYIYALSVRGQPRRVWKEGRVEGFPRLRLGAYDLLLRVLRAAVGERNP